MATGIKRLQRLQMGPEVTPGTAVAATAVWRGAGNQMSDDMVIEEIEEMVGILDGTDRTAIVQLMAGIELSETPLTFEHLPYLLAMGFGGPVTGVADGTTGTGKIYTTNFPTTSLPTAKPYTWEAGDNHETAEMELAVCTGITLKGQHGQTAKMSATLIGRQVSQTTLTGGLSLVAQEDAVVNKGKVYIEAIGGTYGSTQVASQILAFEINLKPKWRPRFTMDGNLYYTTVDYVGHEITGKLTFAHDTAVNRAAGAKLNFMAQTPKLLRVDLIGTAVTQGDGTYTTKHAFIDLPIKYTKAGVLGEDDGLSVVDMEFKSRYNTTAANAGKAVVVNLSTALA